MPQSPADILSDTGPIATHLGSAFESRPEQSQMAAAVAAAMEKRSHLLVEAGTGVGKSFAYLVPAILRCIERGETVVIATNTISLQEQLIEKDIPLLQSLIAPHADPSLPPPLRPVLVKGRGNYVSVRRLGLASKRQDRLFGDPAARRSLHVIEDWAMATRDGTLSTLPPLERMGVWDKVQSDSGNCMGRKCPTYKQCFYQAARARIERGNLFITNHALFFADLNLREQDAGILPKYDHVILDEAHCVEEVASDHFGLALAEGRVTHLLTTLLHPRTGKGYLAQLGLSVSDTDKMSRASRLVEDAMAATRAFFDELRTLIERGGNEKNGGRGASEDRPWTQRGPGGGAASAEPRSVRIRQPGAVTNVLTPVMRDLSLRLKGLRDSVAADEDRFELNAYAIRAEMIATEAEALVTQSLPGCAYWAEISGGDEDSPRGSRIMLGCAPIEVANILRERLFRQEVSVTLTSATLATRSVREDESSESAETAFAHIMSRLGCEGARALQLGSPFDFARQMRVFVERATGDRRRDPETEWRGAHPAESNAGLSPLSAAILQHIEATRGGAFVLFTAFSALNRCASELAGPLARRGYPLVAQGRDGSRTAILQRFRENDTSVLFGAASFWQGVDVRGQGLRNVIIAKLPFDPPDRPLTQARYELIESRGGNPFMEDSLPRAVIKFKQGIGRLIRSKSDTGRVVILDDRVVTARYGRVFLAALPEGVRVEGAGEE